MLVYEGVKTDFIDSVENDLIADQIKQNIFNKMGRHTTDSEYGSWSRSLEYMYKVLNDKEIPGNSGIAIEYNIPQTAKRVDFMISGYNENHNPGMIVIELKQWQKLEKINDTSLVRTYTGHANRDVVHPSYQAWSYTQLISDYNAAVQDQSIELKPCAYLHNYLRRDNDPLDDEQYAEILNEAPAFTKGQVHDLRKFIKSFIKIGDNKEILYEVDHGKIKPSKSLQNSIASMIRGNKEFIMIDEQRVVYENIIKLSERCQKDHKKRTIICEGGPGTGKSVVAVQLLAELTRKEQITQYVSKNLAPRQAYLEKLKKGKKISGVDNMFKGSASYTKVGKNQINTLIVDEAHRLEERSQYTKKTGNENQIKEIIHAAICSVFFIDESQRVTMADIGSVEEIEKWAEFEGSEVYRMKLLSQFRCNGSNGYLSWIDDLLEIRQTANFSVQDLDYDIQIFDTPQEVRDSIVEKNKNTNKARMLAGYCWDWPKGTRDDLNYHDIQIGDFGISWNLDDKKSFAMNENSINEAGCIHTTQGLEFDYVGVIIGDDLRYENGHIVTDFTKRASTDQSIKGLKGMYKKDTATALERADEIIKNTYRTLMTRGMKGCYIYCMDKALSDYIKKRLTI